MPNCSYIHCQALIESPTKKQKIGPNIYYCNWDCYAASGMIKWPGSSHAKALEQMYPEIAERLKKEGKI